MPTTISGTTGIDQVQDNTIATADIQNSAVTAAKLSGAQSGSAPIYGCRAWCVFDGTLTGTNAPTAGGNVTNITRNSAGDYTINFTTAMPDTNYTVQINCSAGNNSSSIVCVVKSATQYGGPSNKTTTAVTVIAGSDYVNTVRDLKEIYVSIFR